MAKSRGKQTTERKPVVDAFVRSIIGGNIVTVGRMLSLIENRDPMANEVMKRLYSRAGRARVIGLTGSAGTGKSSLIDRMIVEFRRRKKLLGILTIDPSSPFSGGALLGDRLRMRDHFLDPGVFIRSLATRNGQGSLPSCVFAAAQLLDAMGKDYILIETIGIGQNQIDIAQIADIVVVVTTPAAGDEIQALKAGVLEIADILVMNKSDLPGAEQMFSHLAELFGATGLPVFKTSALQSHGIAPLIDGIEKRAAELNFDAKRTEKSLKISRAQMLALLRDQLMARLEAKLDDHEIEQWTQRIADKHTDPYTAAEMILAKAGL
jgi:LAO/AO transport system kinase